MVPRAMANQPSDDDPCKSRDQNHDPDRRFGITERVPHAGISPVVPRDHDYRDHDGRDDQPPKDLGGVVPVHGTRMIIYVFSPWFASGFSGAIPDEVALQSPPHLCEEEVGRSLDALVLRGAARRGQSFASGG